LFELPSSNLHFAIVILQFAIRFGNCLPITSGLQAEARANAYKTLLPLLP
jgi:hypothetical protein